MIENYLNIRQIAEKWNLTPRTIRKMCADGRIEGATKLGRDWIIPAEAERPNDGRIKSGKFTNWRKKER